MECPHHRERKISPAWTFSVSYGNCTSVRDRHFNSIDLDTYGPHTTGDGLLSIGLQPGATFDNSNYRAEIAGVLKLGFTTHELLLGRLAETFGTVHLDHCACHLSGRTPRAACHVPTEHL